MSGKKGALGRALLRDKRLSRRAHRDASEVRVFPRSTPRGRRRGLTCEGHWARLGPRAQKHTTELDDGHSWMKYQSITQQRVRVERLATCAKSVTKKNLTLPGYGWWCVCAGPGRVPGDGRARRHRLHGRCVGVSADARLGLCAH